jgi:uncharacterized LabA/DUF88 family protein
MYYALQENPQYVKYKWLNYRKLAENVIGPSDEITGVFYFTAFVTWKPESVIRHKVYIRVLQSVAVETIRGRFMRKDIKCHLCHRVFRTHEEKQSDVNIALKLLSDAVDDLYDRAVIISADSDLLPAIKSVQRHSPEKEIGVMFPIGCGSFELRQNAVFRRKMREALLRECQFPDEVEVGNIIIRRPESWQ